MADLHLRVFNEETHYAIIFGRRFITESYRWYCSNSSSYAILAEVGGKVHGACAVNVGSYYSMFLGVWPSIAAAVFKNPAILARPELRSRSISLVKKVLSGKAKARLHGRESYLAYLSVDPEMRGTGMGRDLIEAAVAESRRRGWGRVVTAIHRSNLPARFMYKTLGFREDSALDVDGLVGIALDPPLAG
jgi:GNAT superfamily N-acetyltransferase